MKKTFAAGFTLIETLMAILVLTIAIVGPLTIASKGLGAALISKDQTTAYLLAQDAIEYIRFKRDSNRLAGVVDSMQGLDGANGCESSFGCMIDSIADMATACSSTCSPLNYDSTNYYFTYTSGTPSIFTRKVIITTPVCASGGGNCNSDEFNITVTLTWHDVGGVSHTISIQENLLDWQKQPT